MSRDRPNQAARDMLILPGSRDGRPAGMRAVQLRVTGNLCFIALALACACGPPARLADQNEYPRAAPGEHESNGELAPRP
jgi:hypothetical protein